MQLRALNSLAYSLTLFVLCAVLVPRIMGDDCTSPPKAPSSCVGTSNCSSWWSDYKAWCVRNGGIPREDGTGCTPGPNWCKSNSGPSDSGSQDSSSSLANALTTAIVYGDAKTKLTAFGIIGTMFALNELLSEKKTPNGTEGSVSPNTQQLEMARRQAELERQRQWKKMLDDMKPVGPPMAELHYKDVFSPGGTNFFGNPANGSLQMKSIEGASVAISISDPMKQLSVAACLTLLAAQATSEDAMTYLSEQAKNAMRGETINVDISSCGGSPTAPALEGRPVFALSPEERTFYEKLRDKTNHEVSVLTDLARKEQDLTRKQQSLEKEIEARRHEAEQIQQELQQIDQQVTPAPDPEAIQKKRSLLAEAQAAFQIAEDDKKKNSAALSETKNKIHEVENTVKVEQDCMEQATADPTKIQSLSKSCGTQ